MTEQTELRQKLEQQKERQLVEYELIKQEKKLNEKQSRITSEDRQNEKEDIEKLGDTTIARAILEPGWSWEKCVKPIAKTNSCQAPHTQYISGRMKVVMNDGTEGEAGLGDPDVIPPGHNA
jgi:hypothetical protein